MLFFILLIDKIISTRFNLSSDVIFVISLDIYETKIVHPSLSLLFNTLLTYAKDYYGYMQLRNNIHGIAFSINSVLFCNTPF